MAEASWTGYLINLEDVVFGAIAEANALVEDGNAKPDPVSEMERELSRAKEHIERFNRATEDAGRNYSTCVENLTEALSSATEKFCKAYQSGGASR